MVVDNEHTNVSWLTISTRADYITLLDHTRSQTRQSYNGSPRSQLVECGQGCMGDKEQSPSLTAGGDSDAVARCLTVLAISSSIKEGRGYPALQ